MTPTPKIEYRCDLCGTLYPTDAEALLCESRPITHDDVEVGDEVLITGGDGAGLRLRVEHKWPVSKDWGHHRAERYWHTISVSGPVLGSYGSRVLTFDQRAPSKP